MISRKNFVYEAKNFIFELSTGLLLCRIPCLMRISSSYTRNAPSGLSIVYAGRLTAWWFFQNLFWVRQSLIPGTRKSIIYNYLSELRFQPDTNGVIFSSFGYAQDLTIPA